MIAGDYPAIPRVAVDGIYGPLTAEAVRTFQSIFGLPATGVVDELNVPNKNVSLHDNYLPLEHPFAL